MNRNLKFILSTFLWTVQRKLMFKLAFEDHITTYVAQIKTYSSSAVNKLSSLLLKMIFGENVNNCTRTKSKVLSLKANMKNKLSAHK